MFASLPRVMLPALVTWLLACGGDGAARPASMRPPGTAGLSATANAGANAVGGARGAEAGGVSSMPGSAGSAGSAPTAAGAASPEAGRAGSAGASGSVAPSAATGCLPRAVSGESKLRFHHVHFNSPDPAADVEFFVKFFNAKAIDFCMDTAGKPTRAIETERGYFLFTRVDQPPDPTLDSHLDHVGWIHPMPSMELQRMMALGVPLWPLGDNLTGQCMEVTMGMACLQDTFFYTKLPSGARIEVAKGPGPSRMGFGHVHLKGPIPDFFQQVLGEALQKTDNLAHVDGVNITNALLDRYPPEKPVDSKGKPIDHVAYSTGDLQATYDRIKRAGIMIQDEIAMRPDYGFRSFFVKTPQGVWVEIVEDSPFAPGATSP